MPAAAPSVLNLAHSSLVTLISFQHQSQCKTFHCHLFLLQKMTIIFIYTCPDISILNNIVLCKTAFHVSASYSMEHFKISIQLL